MAMDAVVVVVVVVAAGGWIRGRILISITFKHMALPLVVVLLSLVLLVPILLVYRLFARSPRRHAPLRTLVVLGSGGHTTEMRQLLSGLDSKYSPVILVVAADDPLSVQKASNWFPAERQPAVERVRRSRAVGQDYLSSVWTTLIALIDAFLVVVRSDPDLVICNGPGTCVPVCVAAKLYSRSTVVFVESFCRVDSLSLTGRLLYFVADHFLVQWPSLTIKYPKTRYCGILV